MADARTSRSPRDVCEGVSRADAQRWRSVCPRRGGEGLVFLWFHPSLHSRLRRVFRAVRTERAAGSNDYPDSAASGLLFPVALCGALPASAIDGNSGVADWASDRAYRASGTPVFLRGRREKLETA